MTTAVLKLAHCKTTSLLLVTRTLHQLEFYEAVFCILKKTASTMKRAQLFCNCTTANRSYIKNWRLNSYFGFATEFAKWLISLQRLRRIPPAKTLSYRLIPLTLRLIRRQQRRNTVKLRSQAPQQPPTKVSGS